MEAASRNIFESHLVRLLRMIYTNGQYHDELLLGMTAEEFDARNGPAAGEQP